MAKRKGLGRGLDSLFSDKKVNGLNKNASTVKTVAQELAEGSVKTQASLAAAAKAEGSSTETSAAASAQAASDTDAAALKEHTLSSTDAAETDAVSANQTNAEQAETSGVLKEVRLSLVQPNLAQPRKDFSSEAAKQALEELAASVKEFGILQPLVVKQQGSLYEIIAGERRWRAAKMAGLTTVPVIVRDLPDSESRALSIIENIQRADLNAVEEALAYQSLMSEYGLTQEGVAQKVSKNRSTITNALRILKLEPEILELLRDGKISQGHARALLAIEDGALRMKIALRCAKEGLSVREIEKLVKLEALARSSREKKHDADAVELKRLKIIYRDLEKKMKAKLGTKVSIVPKDQHKGVLEIEYYSQDELDRIYTMLNSLENNV